MCATFGVVKIWCKLRKSLKEKKTVCRVWIQHKSIYTNIIHHYTRTSHTSSAFKIDFRLKGPVYSIVIFAKISISKPIVYYKKYVIRYV